MFGADTPPGAPSAGGFQATPSLFPVSGPRAVASLQALAVDRDGSPDPGDGEEGLGLLSMSPQSGLGASDPGGAPGERILSPLRSALHERHPSVCAEVALHHSRDAVSSGGEGNPSEGTTPAALAPAVRNVVTASVGCQTMRRGPYELDSKEIRAIRKGDGDEIESLYHEGVLIHPDDSDSEEEDEEEVGYEPPSIDVLLEDARGVFNPQRRIRQLLAGAVDKDGISADSQGRRVKRYGCVTLLERAKLILVRQEQKVAELMKKLEHSSKRMKDQAAQQQKKEEELRGSLEEKDRELTNSTSTTALLRSPLSGSSIAPSPRTRPVPSANHKAENFATTVSRVVAKMRDDRVGAKEKEVAKMAGAADQLRTRALQLVSSLCTMTSAYFAAATVDTSPSWGSFLDLTAAARNLLRKGGVVNRLLDDCEAVGSQPPDRQARACSDALAAIEGLIESGLDVSNASRRGEIGSQAVAPQKARRAQPQQPRPPPTRNPSSRNLSSSPPPAKSPGALPPAAASLSAAPAGAPSLAQLRSFRGNKAAAAATPPAAEAPQPAERVRAEKGKKGNETDSVRAAREERLAGLLGHMIDSLKFQFDQAHLKALDEEAREQGENDFRDLGIEPCELGLEKSTEYLHKMIYRAHAAGVQRSYQFGRTVGAVRQLSEALMVDAQRADAAGFRRRRTTPKEEDFTPSVSSWEFSAQNIRNLGSVINDVIDHRCADAVIQAEHQWKEELYKFNVERCEAERQVLKQLTELRQEQEVSLGPVRLRLFRLLVRGLLVRLRLRRIANAKSNVYNDFMMFSLRRAYLNELAYIGVQRHDISTDVMQVLARDWERERKLVNNLLSQYKNRGPQPRTEVHGYKAYRPFIPTKPDPPSHLTALFEHLNGSLLTRADLFTRAGYGLRTACDNVKESQSLIAGQMRRLRNAERERLARWHKVRDKEHGLSAYATRIARGMFAHDHLRDFQPKRAVNDHQTWSSAMRPMAGDRDEHISGNLGMVFMKIKEEFRKHMAQRNAGPQPSIVGSQVRRPRSPRRNLVDVEQDRVAERRAAAASQSPPLPRPPSPPRGWLPPIVGGAPPVEVTYGGVHMPLTTFTRQSSPRLLQWEGTPELSVAPSSPRGPPLQSQLPRCARAAQQRSRLSI
eukprot:TRINITY_DN9683_c0_g1_i2.p1 TRINITY_DN9683_c0_g1~~TRINITY_DN9683_c0_g1_i2.p1  ORF type:complete len:1140 (+),score=220.84 TRINITY_DN9683_c0_g1_i2:85-3504(+)